MSDSPWSNPARRREMQQAAVASYAGGWQQYEVPRVTKTQALVVLNDPSTNSRMRDGETVVIVARLIDITAVDFFRSAK